MSQKIKVAIDISPLNNDNAVRGVGYYTKNLVEALQKINDPHFDVKLITHNSDLTNFDLVHYPYFDPFSLTLPSKTKIPTIVTVHDLIPRQFKSHFPVGLKGEIKWQMQRFRVCQSTLIITVSHYSKYIIADLLHYPADRIYVTHEAANSDFKPITNQKLLTSLKNKYQLPNKFVLYVGDINWNKNVPNLVKACLKLKYPLVIAGSAAAKKVPDHPWTKDIHWLQSQKSPYLKLLGFVPDKDLPILYNLATIYCQPSYAEGFGLPLVEAMQSGTPVVYSQETSLPEIMDYNGEFFDPHTPGSLESALKKIWNSSTLQREYSTQGLKRAQIFNWQYTALQTLAVYQQALLYGQ
jgi:glycosyltransferase involved in cell wall biosynthesis